MHYPSQIGGPGFTRAPVALALHLIDLVPIHVGAGIEDDAQDVRCRSSDAGTLTTARPEVSPDEDDPPVLAEEPPVHRAESDAHVRVPFIDLARQEPRFELVVEGNRQVDLTILTCMPLRPTEGRTALSRRLDPRRRWHPRRRRPLHREPGTLGVRCSLPASGPRHRLEATR